MKIFNHKRIENDFSIVLTLNTLLNDNKSKLHNLQFILSKFSAFILTSFNKKPFKSNKDS